MALHHVNHNTGNVGICKAKKGGCPFGGESGDDNHYNTPQEAQAAAEKLMAEQHSAINAAYRKKDTSGLADMSREMKKRIIAEAVSGENGLHPSVVAKVFSKDDDELIRKNISEQFKSQKILREMADDESARVRLAVAKATNNPEVLKAFANDPDVAVRKAAAANSKMPVKVRKETLAALGVNYSGKKTAAAPKVTATPKAKIPSKNTLPPRPVNAPIIKSAAQRKEARDSLALADAALRVGEAENAFNESKTDLERLTDEERDEKRAALKAHDDLIKIKNDRDLAAIKYKTYDFDNETDEQAEARQDAEYALDERQDEANERRKEALQRIETIKKEKEDGLRAHHELKSRLFEAERYEKYVEAEVSKEAPKSTPSPKKAGLPKAPKAAAPKTAPKAAAPKKSGLPTAPKVTAPAAPKKVTMRDEFSSLYANAPELQTEKAKISLDILENLRQSDDAESRETANSILDYFKTDKPSARDAASMLDELTLSFIQGASGK